ncbi:MAG: hypothetical protein ACRD63_01360 [Pyrinomonadaceae bacterium]
MKTEVKTRIKIWSALMIIFALGCATGVALDGLYRDGVSAYNQNSNAYMEKLQYELSLAEDQSKQVQVIIDQARNEYQQLRDVIKPQCEAVRQKARGQIHSLLSPEQQQKYDRIVEQNDAERKMRQGQGYK